MRFPPGGGVRLSFVKTLASNAEVLIGSETIVSGLSYQQGVALSLSFAVTGTNPTTLQAKAWLAGSAEPSQWALTATDSTAALQSGGQPGVRVFLGGGSTNLANWLFDNFVVTDLAGP